MVTIGGETHCVIEWSELSGIHPGTIAARLNRGIGPDALLRRPRDQRRMLSIDGEIKTIAEWCRVSGVSRPTVAARLGKGWDPKRAVFDPPMPRRVIR